MEAAPQRKRRKWDVASPQGVPIQAGQITAAPAAATQAVSAAVPVPEPKPSQPMGADAIARAKQDAAAIMQKINKVQQHFCPLRLSAFTGSVVTTGCVAELVLSGSDACLLVAAHCKEALSSLPTRVCEVVNCLLAEGECWLHAGPGCTRYGQLRLSTELQCRSRSQS